jgi:hypothetical protein
LTELNDRMEAQQNLNRTKKKGDSFRLPTDQYFTLQMDRIATSRKCNTSHFFFQRHPTSRGSHQTYTQKFLYIKAHMQQIERVPDSSFPQSETQDTFQVAALTKAGALVPPVSEPEISISNDFNDTDRGVTQSCPHLHVDVPRGYETRPRKARISQFGQPSDQCHPALQVR